MLFPTFEFFLFFAAVLALNWILKSSPLLWRLFLLAISYFFYSLFDVRFLLIIFLVSLFNFIGGKIIEKNCFPAKKIYLFFIATANLSVLAIFKYYDFFRIPANNLLEKFGFSATIPLLEIILPVGLSFYIFRAISYNVDIYRGKIMAEPFLLDFFIYVSFFPQLLSGPIARAEEFLPQLKNGGTKTIEDLYGNIALILSGLFKKLIISTYLVILLTDGVFSVPENHSQLAILLAIFAYSLVIYCDFSGYSDMAIGFAGLMGFKSPVNFNFPYLASNIQDFWRRWHVSLSSWIKDYIYIPLGGSRKGKIRKYFNLMAAMVLAGLWHGAAAHFIIWGALLGGGLILTHIYFDKKGYLEPLPQRPKPIKKLKIFLGWLLTFNFISFCWIFFRANTTEDAFRLIENLFTAGRISENLSPLAIFLIIGGVIFILLEKNIISGLVKIQEKMPSLLWLLFIVFAIMAVFHFSPDTLPPFIYFSF